MFLQTETRFVSMLRKALRFLAFAMCCDVVTEFVAGGSGGGSCTKTNCVRFN